MLQIKEKLLKILKEKSYVKGAVTLSSGAKSDFYIDCKKTFLTPRGAILGAELILDMLKLHNVKCDAIAGVALGGCPLATATSMLTGTGIFTHELPAIYVRTTPKRHGMLSLIEGQNDEIKNVILLEDVITTGKSTEKAINNLNEHGINVCAVFVVVNRSSINTIDNIPVYSMYTPNDFVDKDDNL